MYIRSRTLVTLIEHDSKNDHRWCRSSSVFRLQQQHNNTAGAHSALTRPISRLIATTLGQSGQPLVLLIGDPHPHHYTPPLPPPPPSAFVSSRATLRMRCVCGLDYAANLLQSVVAAAAGSFLFVWVFGETKNSDSCAGLL